MRPRRTTRFAAVLFAAGVLAIPVASVQAQVGSATGSEIRMSGRVQAQYEASEDSPSSFFLRRAWATIDGRIDELVSGRIQVDLLGGTALEAYLALTASESLRFTVGQFKRGMSYFWYVANFDLPVIERDARVPGVDSCPGVGSVCSFGNFGASLGLHQYEPGIMATGTLGGGRTSYRVSLTNGEGLGGRDVNDGKSLSARLVFGVGQNSRVSLYGALDDRATDSGSVHDPAYGLEWETGTWRSGPHFIVGVMGGRNWKVSDETPFVAFQGLGLWNVPLNQGSRFKAVEPMVRVSWARTEDVAGTEAAGLVVTPGFMLYATGANGIAANLDIYRPLGEVGSGSGDGTAWSLKVQAFTRF